VREKEKEKEREEEREGEEEIHIAKWFERRAYREREHSER